MPAPLLGQPALDLLREALDGFTVAGVHERLGPAGSTAQDRGELAGVGLALNHQDDRLASLIRLFLLGVEVSEAEAEHALAPLPLATAGPLVRLAAGCVRAAVEVRPYGEADNAEPWWVVSDFGSDVRPGPLAPHHVLGIGAASLTLASAVPRRPAARALDLGTGCGVQALHLAGHSDSVVATDISERALQLAATTAALSGQHWDLRAGSLLDPVADDHFDIIVANPPFVVSPGLHAGQGGFDYRDSGMAGDKLSETLLRTLPARLAADGTASLLANWTIPADGEWTERVTGWLADSGCDAWVWQREVADPVTYVELWLRDAGEVAGTQRWIERYDSWLHWFDTSGIAAVGMGLVTLWHNPRGTTNVVCEDVPQAVEQPAGTHLQPWVNRQRWLNSHDDAALLNTPLTCPDDVVWARTDTRTARGWTSVEAQLRQSGAMRWQLDVDDAVAGVVGSCDGSVPLAVPLGLLAATLGRPASDVAAALLPVIRDLIGRGFLLPDGVR